MTGTYVSMHDLISFLLYVTAISLWIYVDVRRSNRDKEDRRDALRLLAQAEDRIEKRLEYQWVRIGREEERLRNLEELMEGNERRRDKEFERQQEEFENSIEMWAIEHGAKDLKDWLAKRKPNGQEPTDEGGKP
jgi:hypothetical protein